MECYKCHGSGTVDNPKYYTLGAARAYENNVLPSKRCKECGGSGFIIQNMQEVLEHLIVLRNQFKSNKQKELLRSINQCIKIITE